MLECAAVSYGKAMSYLPVINLLKSYFEIRDRDGLQTISDKVTGKLLALDRALEPTLPALLALLDVPVDDAAWQSALTRLQRRRRMLDGVTAAAAAGSTRAATSSDLRGSALDRRRDAGAARRPCREPGVGAPAAARDLSARVPAWLGQQDILQSDTAGRASSRKRRAAAGRASRRRSSARTTQAAPGQTRQSRSSWRRRSGRWWRRKRWRGSEASIA